MKDLARQSLDQGRTNKFYHEGHEEHEVKKLKISMSETFVAFVCFVVKENEGIVPGFTHKSL